MLIALSVPANSDTLEMSNGDRLSGKVVTMVEGTLTLETEYAGVVELEWAQVAHLTLAESLPAVLADGTELRMELLPTEQVTRGDVVALAPPPPAPAPPVKWRGRADFGWAHAEGNRNTELGTLTMFAQRERVDRYRLSLLFDAAQGSSGGEETANRARVEGKFDRRAERGKYQYYLAGAGYDRIRNVDLRAEVGTGVGRTLVDKPGHLLTAEIGASYVQDAFATGVTESDAKLRLGETWQRELGQGTALRQTLSLLSAADELGDYTGEFVLALTHELTDRMSLTTKFVDTYDSRPAVGTKRNDFTLATQVGWAFGD